MRTNDSEDKTIEISKTQTDSWKHVLFMENADQGVDRKVRVYE